MAVSSRRVLHYIAATMGGNGRQNQLPAIAIAGQTALNRHQSRAEWKHAENDCRF
jgi:hypothetical protein